MKPLLTVPLRELVERYFESDEVKAAVAIGAFDMGDISAPGSAYITALYRFSAFREDTENYGIVRGGMGGITQSLARSAEASGVSIRTGAPVKRILSKEGRGQGCRTRKRRGHQSRHRTLKRRSETHLSQAHRRV